MSTRSIVTMLAAASSMLVAADVRADCASGPAYGLDSNGSTVSITLDTSGERTCPDPGGMIRQDEATGAVVVLAPFCSGASTYVDECVPPGTYRYGLLTPYTCTGSCPGSAYFGEVTVTAPLDANCARSTGDDGPTATTDAPPWGVGAEPAKFCPSKGGGCFCDSTTASVVSLNGVALAAGAVAIALGARRRRKRG